MSIDILISTSIISPLYPLTDGVKADEEGAYLVKLLCFVTGYLGPVSLTIYHNDSEEVYTAYTNEYGSVGFPIAGIIPYGEKEKKYPITVSTPDEKQATVLTVSAA